MEWLPLSRLGEPGYLPVPAGDRRPFGVLHHYHDGDHRSTDPVFQKNSRALLW